MSVVKSHASTRHHPPTIRDWPFFEYFKNLIVPLSAWIVSMQANVARSHSLIVLSPLPEARRRPSGENANDETSCVWPDSVAAAGPVRFCQSRIVSSPEPEAKSVPSGLDFSAQTLPVCPLSVHVISCVIVSQT